MKSEITATDIKPYFQAMINIMYTGHWLTDHINSVLKPFGISEPQYNVLRILEDVDDTLLAQQEIQALMIQKSSNVSRIIDKLIEKNYVNRSICQTNRRKMDICLTIEGKKFLKKASKEVNFVPFDN